MEKDLQLLIAKDAMTVVFHSVKITWWVEPEDQQADIPARDHGESPITQDSIRKNFSVE